MKKLSIISIILCCFVCIGMASAGEYKGREIKAKLASEDLEDDFMTVWAKKFSEEMKQWSDGKIDITVYPYGSLGDLRDINELCQYGVVDYVFTDYGWISSFVPEAQVLALHYLWPKERAPEVLAWVMKNGRFLGVLEKSFRRVGLVPLGVMWEDWMWITSKKPIHSIEDLNGLKLRLMSSKLLVEQWKAYGATPTPMSYGEVYGGLQMGLIDAAMNPIFADYSMKIYEVTDHFVINYAEAYLGIPTVNMKFFDSLPKNAQEKMRQFWADANMPSSRWMADRNKTDLEKIKQERPNITFTELSDAEIEKFKKIAIPNYPDFVKVGGKNAQEVMDALIQDVANAKKALGI